MRHYHLMAFLLAISVQVYSQVQDPQFKDPQNMKVKPANTDCQELPDTFNDRAEALEVIQNTRFHYHQKIKTTRKSGLMQASFLSCDFKTGYLVVRYDGKDRIYPNIGLQLWEQFQQTNDIDGYYFKNIENLPSIP